MKKRLFKILLDDEEILLDFNKRHLLNDNNILNDYFDFDKSLSYINSKEDLLKIEPLIITKFFNENLPTFDEKLEELYLLANKYFYNILNTCKVVLPIIDYPNSLVFNSMDKFIFEYNIKNGEFMISFGNVLLPMKNEFGISNIQFNEIVHKNLEIYFEKKIKQKNFI